MISSPNWKDILLKLTLNPWFHGYIDVGDAYNYVGDRWKSLRICLKMENFHWIWHQIEFHVSNITYRSPTSHSGHQHLKMVTIIKPPTSLLPISLAVNQRYHEFLNRIICNFRFRLTCFANMIGRRPSIIIILYVLASGYSSMNSVEENKVDNYATLNSIL